MKHFFDVEFAFGLDRIRPQTPAPDPHSSHTSPADPDTTPEPSPTPQAPPRPPEPPAYDPSDTAGADALIALTNGGLSPLAAAQSLYAPHLLEH